MAVFCCGDIALDKNTPRGYTKGMNPVRNTLVQRQFLRENHTNNKLNFVRDEAKYQEKSSS